uniref:Uncharacterized protein n=1 Tax=Megaselia scalaris TaxID=36166 RepID=T1GT16_MEGSC
MGSMNSDMTLLDINLRHIEKLVTQLLGGELEPYIPVKIVVAKNFQELITDNGIASWCGQSKKLNPI